MDPIYIPIYQGIYRPSHPRRRAVDTSVYGPSTQLSPPQAALDDAVADGEKEPLPIRG
ncbi:hypothetical protein [Streptomyces murinus]|uniref:hypothetical protein n=1 Tax=Streptomyces murinus TaxID=33900 RepID=UPI003816A457